MDSINSTQPQLNTASTLPGIVRISLAILFLFAIMIYVGGYVDERNTLLIVAAVIGGYMALNIGANDVANNVGPAVGSKAITLTGAILIAAIFESSGALLAGGDVVSTIKKGIIDPALINDTDTFVWLMTSALLAAALWLNLSTYFGAPVSTTHSIVGGVLGAGIAAGGFGIANWAVFGKIAASWFISPNHGRCYCGPFSVPDKTNDHLQNRHAVCRQRRCADFNRINGLGFFNLPHDERV